MNKLYYILLICLCLLPSAETAAQVNIQHQKDSLRKALTLTEGEDKLITYFRLTNLYYPELHDSLKRDTLIALYNEWDAEEERLGGSHRASIMTNKLFVYNSANLYDSVIKYAPVYLEFMEKAGNARTAYYQSYRSLVAAYNKKGDNDNALLEAQKMYAHAEERTLIGGMGSALYAMSEIYDS